MAGYVSMVEYAKTFQVGTKARAMIETFTAESDVMAACPIKSVAGGKHTFFRTARLPTVAQRALNAAGTSGAGNLSKFEDGVGFSDHFVRVDRALLDTFGEEHRAKQERLAAIAISQEWTRVFLKGSSATTAGVETDGLQARLTTADTTLFHNSTGSGGGALSLTNLDKVIRAVRRPTHIIADLSFMHFFDKAARDSSVSGFIMQPASEQTLGREVIKYRGLPILTGYPPEDSPSILPFTEVGAGGGSAVTGSIYVVSFQDEGVCGIEGTPLTVKDEGQIPGTTDVSTHIKWDFGITMEHSRSAARLTSITLAAITA